MIGTNMEREWEKEKERKKERERKREWETVWMYMTKCLSKLERDRKKYSMIEHSFLLYVSVLQVGNICTPQGKVEQT